MKKASLFHIPILLIGFLTLIALNIQAQENVKTSSKNGVTKVEFETPKGKIIITLPAKVHSGDIISGTVIAEPKGKNKKQINKNKKILKGYIIDLDNNKNESSKQEKIKWNIPDKINKSSLPLLLKDLKGNVIGQADIPLNTKKRENSTSQFLDDKKISIPSYVVVGEACIIRGVFDGNFINSSIKINGYDISILVESPEEIIFNPPTNFNGLAKIEISENNLNFESEINILELELGADKLDLKKGEQTFINIKVSGLKGLKENITMEIENLSNNINMSGGNLQQVMIDPYEDCINGICEYDVKVTALMDGDFSVKVSIKPPL